MIMKLCGDADVHRVNYVPGQNPDFWMVRHLPDFVQLTMLMMFHHNTDSKTCRGQYQPDN